MKRDVWAAKLHNETIGLVDGVMDDRQAWKSVGVKTIDTTYRWDASSIFPKSVHWRIWVVFETRTVVDGAFRQFECSDMSIFGIDSARSRYHASNYRRSLATT